MVYLRINSKMWLFLLLELAVLAFFSLWRFDAMPKFWRDEAIPFDIARTFVETGKLDLGVAPGVVEELSYKTHATGFVVTLPLALWMRVFGVGIAQARVLMALWIAVMVFTLFFVLKSFMGERAAVVGTLLVSTFSSLYANGRTATGEIPGFFFLLIALFFLYKKERAALGGFFLALSAIAKPSTYAMVLPAALLEILFFQKNWRAAARVIAGAAPALLVWIWVILPGPFSPKSWQALLDFYAHPFREASLWSHPSMLIHPTILYFAALVCVVAFGLWRGAYSGAARNIVRFMFLFGLFAVVYFLRSPGYLRYLLPVELLALALLWPALERIFTRQKLFSVFVAGGLAVLQVVVFFFFADIPSGTASRDAARFVNERLLADPGATVGFVEMPTVAALVASRQKYQYGAIGGRDFYGVHPLAYSPDALPTYIIAYNNDFRPYDHVLDEYYDDAGLVLPTGQKVYKRL